MNLTKDQQHAVDIKGTNVIVSAGAGSGKTTVLKTRVLRELLDGVTLNNLIILTFTRNAASEMKERIRKIISENASVSKESEYLDSAFITTFDSFAQSIVKKYNYLLNIGKDFTIADSLVIKIEIKKYIEEIFEDLYKNEDEVFEDLISKYCIKDDKKIKEAVLNIYEKYNQIINKEEFTNSIDKYFSKDFIEKAFESYENIVFSIKDEIVKLLEEINDETIKREVLESNIEKTSSFCNASSYDELLSYPLETLKNGKDAYTEEGKELKKVLSEKKKELKEYLTEPKEVLISNYMLTKKYALMIIRIIKELDNKVMNFKLKHNTYEFNDIALKAIELVKNHEEVRNEIKNSTFEIIIDEYQDTNDIQETFISYISNNNVYVVGDVKQSIYRFRNANPSIFKEKYNSYRDTSLGEKIDLNENFRSRNEVVTFINEVFSIIMNEQIGGANYKDEHKMIFGNKTYNNYLLNNYKTEILKYSKKFENFSAEEIEAFIIADDIENRIKAKENVLIFEKTPVQRNITYKDFAVLVDKSTNFELLKKVLESKGIPSTIYKDINIKNEDEIYILKNIISLIVNIKNKEFNDEFKHAFLSISRSYLINMTDEEIYDIFETNTFKSTSLYKKCLALSQTIDGTSIKEIVYKIIESFDFYNKIITVDSVNERLTKLEYFLNSSDSLNRFGMDIYKLKDYFEEILASEDKLEMPANISETNSVKIMTVHKSKGLEFNYVYLPFLYNKFKFEKKSDFRLTENFGLIMPFYNNGIGNSFISIVENEISKTEDLSERIRLFYVALTRSKEKLILLDQNNERKNSSVVLRKATSNSDLLYIAHNYISKYYKEIDLTKISLNKNYNLIKDYNYKKNIEKTDKKILTKELLIENEKLENKHFSKELNNIINNEVRNALNYGTYMHRLFEVYDFKNDNINQISARDEEKEAIKKFLNHEEVKNIKNAKVFKEHEIYFTKDSKAYKGIIDLLVKYNDHFDIIDYKLSNVESEDYTNQLNGYKSYIEGKYELPVNIYLYSILKDTFKKI